MTLAKHVHGFALALAATATVFASAPDAYAEAVTLTDIAGREVTLTEMTAVTIATMAIHALASRTDRLT